MNLIFSFLLLVLSVPIGYFLKRITIEEIPQGRVYFKIIVVASLILTIIFFMVNINYNLKLSIIFTLLFIANVAFISWKKH